MQTQQTPNQTLPLTPCISISLSHSLSLPLLYYLWGQPDFPVLSYQENSKYSDILGLLPLISTTFSEAVERNAELFLVLKS